MIRCVLASLLTLLFASLAWAAGTLSSACADDVPCRIGDRSYHIKTPDGWDGKTALPVLMHFHGWQRQGTLIVKHQRISGATRRRGVLLVAPNGLNRSWDFRNSNTKDVAFARAVLEDVKKTYPVVSDQVFVSGYSWGSNMAWRFVCQDGDDIAALLAISGTLNQSEICPAAPREVRQVYGLNDGVLAYPFGPGGEQNYPVHLWRTKFGCGAGRETGPWQQVPFLTLQRIVWDTCSAGRVSLDIHAGGHFIPHGWLARQLDEILKLPLSYP